MHQLRLLEVGGPIEIYRPFSVILPENPFVSFVEWRWESHQSVIDFLGSDQFVCVRIFGEPIPSFDD